MNALKKGLQAPRQQGVGNVHRRSSTLQALIALIFLISVPMTSRVDAKSAATATRPKAASAQLPTVEHMRVPAENPAPIRSFWYAVWRQALGTTLGGSVSLFVLLGLVYRYQQQNERQKLIHEVSKEFGKLAETPCVVGLYGEGINNQICYTFTVALTRRVRWHTRGKIQHDFTTPDRLLLISGETGRISSTVLHEALFWFRRVHRARRSRLLHDFDLYQMWRQILPFVTDGRYTFLRRYWGQDDITSILDIAGCVICYCTTKNIRPPLDYLRGDTPSEAPRVDCCFVMDLKARKRLFPILRIFPRPGPLRAVKRYRKWLVSLDQMCEKKEYSGSENNNRGQ